MQARQEDLDRFYCLLARLQERCGGMRKLSESDGRMGWPQRGVYFFFEPGEFREDGVTPRVVRVGTHGLKPTRSTLWGRLSQHRGNLGGSMPGGGNHRGSIFRLHVGFALLATGGWSDDVRATWGRGSSAPKEVRQREFPLERAVSEHIGSMPFLWAEVDDAPSASSERGVIERGAIALLSNLDKPAIDEPSNAWLGRSADRDVVRRSGLWNVNHVSKQHDPRFLDAVGRLVG